VKYKLKSRPFHIHDLLSDFYQK